jgi:acetyltransferase-like isoleucine patch superfamily enzyme
MEVILYKIIRKVKWFYRIFLSWIFSHGLESAGHRPYFGKDTVMLGMKNIIVGDNFIMNDRSRVKAVESNGSEIFNPQIRIGHNVTINYDCHIAAIQLVEIGNNVLFASRIYISDHNHGTSSFQDMKLPPVLRPVVSKGPVIIGDNVWIGEGAVILANVTVGNNSIIAANAVVTRDVPAFSVAAGVPAQIIKTVTS